MQNPHDHSARRKLFARAFSNSNLKSNWEADIRRKTMLAVDKIQVGATQPGKGADILKWWTLMATDVITQLSFGESFEMLEQGKVRNIIFELKIESDLELSKLRISMRCSSPCLGACSAPSSLLSTPCFDTCLSKPYGR